MAGEWTRSTIGELVRAGDAHLQTGPFGTALKAAEYSQTGVPLISVGEVREGYFHITATTPRVSVETTKRLPKFLLQQGDIVFGRKGSIDRNAMIGAKEQGWFLGSDGIRLRLDPKFDSQFFSYQMRNPATRAWLLQNGEGSTMPSLNQGILERLPVTTPPLPEQKRIAHVLGTLDDKIELNRRMNATLEAMSRAIFKSWFVDFDPVRQKAAGKQPVGMDAQTAALFPDAFEDSEIGEVPKGWRVAPLDEVADYLNGLALQKYPAGDGPTLPVIKIAQLRKGDAAGADRCNDAVPAEYVIEDGDVLFSWSGSLEVVIWCGGRGALNQHLFKVTSESYPKWFYHLWTLYHLADFRLIAADKATTMGHIQRKHLSAAKAIVPPIDCLEGMTRTMEPLLLRSVRTSKESRALAALRDTLLPKLLSGEVRVPEAAEAIEEVLG